MPRKDIVRSRRDTAANWTSVNPTLLLAEFGYETDTGKFKMGDGTTAWSSLAYVAGLNGADGSDGSDGSDGTDGSDAEAGHIVEGRLTLTSGSAIPSADVTGAVTLYFTPHHGNRVRIYDGTDWVVHTFTELSLSLTLVDATNYDVFIYDNSGTLTLEVVAWTSDNSRGVGSPVVLQDGVYVKSGATTRLLLGTIRASGTNTAEDSETFRGVSNLYNQTPRRFYYFTSDDVINNVTEAWAAYDNDSTHKVDFITCFPVLLRIDVEARLRTEATANVGLNSATSDFILNPSIRNFTNDVFNLPSVGFEDVSEGHHELFLAMFGDVLGADFYSMSVVGAIPA